MKKIKDLSQLEAEKICKKRAEKIGSYCGKCTGCPLTTKSGYCYKYYLKGIRNDIFCPECVKTAMEEIEENEVEI